MAWGRSSGTGSAASDLVTKVTANKIDSLFVLKFRKFGERLLQSARWQSRRSSYTPRLCQATKKLLLLRKR